MPFAVGLPLAFGETGVLRKGVSLGRERNTLVDDLKRAAMARLSCSSLRVRLLLLVLVALLPALGLILYTSSRLREVAAQDARHDSLHVVRTLATEHERIIESGYQLLRSLAHLPQILN